MPKLRGGFIFNADEGVSGSGGGGGGSVAILDEGVQILASATAINFVGANITAIANGSQAIVYSPPPTFVSHFNTTDGIGSCSVGNFSVTSRKVSAPTSEGTPFKIGSWTAASFQNTTNSSTLNFTTTTIKSQVLLSKSQLNTASKSDKISVKLYQKAKERFLWHSQKSKRALAKPVFGAVICA